MSRMPRSIVTLAGLLALAIALAAGPARAQVTGLYYQEVEKDGRIYVFNAPETYAAWSESGEMGKSITLVGRGPNGETVVAENETAADLFFFKHGLPGYDRPSPRPEKPPFTLVWKDGKTTIDTKLGRLALSNRVQIRFTQELPEEGEDRGSFRIRRAKTKFEGWVYTPQLTYELQLNWPDGSNPLEDANVNYDFTGKKAFMLKAGQFKAPFGRQELTSSGSQEFVDRSIVSNEFARGRDIGLQLWGQPLGGKLDWRLGVFNGAGRTVSRNDNDEYQVDARVAWQPFGDVKYSEGDFEATDRPLFQIAAQWESNERPVAASGSSPADFADRQIAGADVVFKYKGLFAFAEYFDATTERGIAPDFDSEGFTAQVGYFFLPRKFEVAGRYAVLDPNAGRDGDDRIERGAAASWYFNKHAHKLQLDYRQIEDEARDQTNDELRLQYQVIF
jgi:phosphate-selective porin OprO and OprP